MKENRKRSKKRQKCIEKGVKKKDRNGNEGKVGKLKMCKENKTRCKNVSV